MSEVYVNLQSSDARLSARGRQAPQRHGSSPPALDDNDFEYVRMLSEGSYGDVHECIHTATGQRVAIKRFKAAHTDIQVWRLALREARVLQTLPRHPHVVRLMRAVCSQASGRLYFVFELMGGSLAQEMARHPGGALPGPLLKTVARQLLAGIAHCHGHGIVHRDIKPGNALISRLSPSTRYRSTDGYLKDSAFSGTVPGRSGTSSKGRRDLDDTSNTSSGGFRDLRVEDHSSRHGLVHVKLCDFGFARRVPSASLQTGKIDDNKNASCRRLAPGKETTSGKNVSSVAERFICGSFLGRLLLSSAGSSRGVCVHRRFTADGSVSDRDDEGEGEGGTDNTAIAADAGTGVNGEQQQVEDMSCYTVTRWYRPPEILINAPYGLPVDIWSYGCTIAELASGQPLFPGRSSVDQMWRIMRCQGPLPRSLAGASRSELGLAASEMPPVRGRSLAERLPGVDPQLLDLISACLALDPARRLTAAQLLKMPYFADLPSPQPNLPHFTTANEAKRCDASTSASYVRAIKPMAYQELHSLSRTGRRSSCTAVPIVLANSDIAGNAAASVIIPGAPSRNLTSKSNLAGSAPITKSRLLALTVQTVSATPQAPPSTPDSPSRQSAVGTHHPKAEPSVSVSGLRQQVSAVPPSAALPANELPNALLINSSALLSGPSAAGVQLAATHRPLSKLFPSVASGVHAPVHAMGGSVGASGVWDVGSDDWLPPMTASAMGAPVVGKANSTRSKASFGHVQQPAHCMAADAGAGARVDVRAATADPTTDATAAAAAAGGRGGGAAAASTGLSQLLEIVGASKNSSTGGGRCDAEFNPPVLSPLLSPERFAEFAEGSRVASTSTCLTTRTYAQPPLMSNGSAALNAQKQQEEPPIKPPQLPQQPQQPQPHYPIQQQHPLPSSSSTPRQQQQQQQEHGTRQGMFFSLLTARQSSVVAPSEARSSSVIITAGTVAPIVSGPTTATTTSPGHGRLPLPRKLPSSTASSNPSRHENVLLHHRCTVGGYQASANSSVNGMGIISVCDGHLLSGPGSETCSGIDGTSSGGICQRRIIVANGSTGGYGSVGGGGGGAGGYYEPGMATGPSAVMRSAIGAFVEVSRDLNGGCALLTETEASAEIRGGEQNMSEAQMPPCGPPYVRGGSQRPLLHGPSCSHASSRSAKVMPNGALAPTVAVVSRQARRTVPGAMSYSTFADGSRCREDAGGSSGLPAAVGGQPPTTVAAVAHQTSSAVGCRLQPVPSNTTVLYTADGAQGPSAGDTPLSENVKRPYQPQTWVGTTPSTPPGSLLLASVPLASGNGSWTLSSTNIQPTGQPKPRAMYSAVADLSLLDGYTAVAGSYNGNVVLHDVGGVNGGQEFLLASTMMVPIPLETDDEDEDDSKVSSLNAIAAVPNMSASASAAGGTTSAGLYGSLATIGTTMARTTIRTAISTAVDEQLLSVAVPAPMRMSYSIRSTTSLPGGGGRTRFGPVQIRDEPRNYPESEQNEVEEGKRKGKAANGIMGTLRKIGQGAKRLKAKALAKFQ